MKSKFLTIILICVSAFGHAQDFEKGGNYVNVGLTADVYHKYVALSPGIVATYERGITDIIGIGRIGAGGGIGFNHYSYSHYVPGHDHYHKTRATRISIIGRATYHFEFNIEKMDVYAGLGPVLNINTHKETGDDVIIDVPSTFSANHYVFAGIRYYFTDKLGVYAELGHGHRTATAGLAIKF